MTIPLFIHVYFLLFKHIKELVFRGFRYIVNTINDEVLSRNEKKVGINRFVSYKLEWGQPFNLVAPNVFN